MPENIQESITLTPTGSTAPSDDEREQPNFSAFNRNPIESSAADEAGEDGRMLESDEGDNHSDDRQTLLRYEDHTLDDTTSDPEFDMDIHQMDQQAWAGPQDDWSESRISRGHKKRVYGGGKHGQGGTLGPGQVAGLILVTTLGPTPLLLAHAAALLGLPLFLPLLLIISILSWFSYLILGAESRYVGAKSWPSLAAAVYPHRFRIHKFGEFWTSLFVLFLSLARGILSVAAVADLFIDSIWIREHGRGWRRAVVVACITLVGFIYPLFAAVFLRKPIQQGKQGRGAFIIQSTPYLTGFIWIAALIILGARINALRALRDIIRHGKNNPNIPLFEENPLPVEREAMGLSVWGGVVLLVVSLSAHQDTFTFLTSLARPSSTASRTSVRSALMANRGSSTSNASEVREGRRNQWPLASALGVGLCAVIQLGWGLVGYLGIEGGGREGNVFASSRLPKDDWWLSCARIMIIFVISIGIGFTLESAYQRMYKFLMLLTPSKEPGIPQNNHDLRRGKPKKKLALLSNMIVWIIVGGVSIGIGRFGSQGEPLVDVAQVAGCFGSTVLGFFTPAIFFIILFHLRRPRSIFVADPNAPSVVSDALLMQKERQVQRRLSGRRIWQDVLVFGGLLPFGIVVLIRGCIALVDSIL